MGLLLLPANPSETACQQAGPMQSVAGPGLQLCAPMRVHRSQYLSIDCRQADLQRMDILINGEAVDALARIVHREKAQHVGRRLVAKLRVRLHGRSVADCCSAPESLQQL